jgi:hypothetical protein
LPQATNHGMKFTRVPISLALIGVASFATGFNQPAKALGGGVVVSQATPGSGNTVVTSSGNIVDPGTGYNYTAGQAVNFSFTTADSFTLGSSWNGGADPFYAFDGVDYTALSGNTFSGTFSAVNTDIGTLEIYRSGLVKFDIASSVSPTFTGLTVNGASIPTALNRYLVQFNVGSNFASVPTSAPGSIPTIASLLSSAVGSYGSSSGEIQRASEGLATYASTAPTPGPLPILGVGVAFSQSRRLRKRIKSR